MQNDVNLRAVLRYRHLHSIRCCTDSVYITATVAKENLLRAQVQAAAAIAAQKPRQDSSCGARVQVGQSRRRRRRSIIPRRVYMYVHFAQYRPSLRNRRAIIITLIIHIRTLVNLCYYSYCVASRKRVYTWYIYAGGNDKRIYTHIYTQRAGMSMAPVPPSSVE